MSSRASPKKAAVPSRALQEIKPVGIRRNSPSFNQITKKPNFPNVESSPLDTSGRGNSPRLLYWKQRESASPGGGANSENEIPRSPSPNRRVSVEALKQASRVKNTNFYALEQEHDSDLDNSSIIDRPASERRFGNMTQGNAFAGTGLSRMTRNDQSPPKNPLRTELVSKGGLWNPMMAIMGFGKQVSPSKEAVSPPKESALLSGDSVPMLNKSARVSRETGSPHKSSFASSSKFGVPGTFYNDDSIVQSETGVDGLETGGTTPRQGLRPYKSVTFDEAPPQVNEYEMATPAPSSLASGSRNGSPDSDDESEGDGHGDIDSFDESLEDADKTPVVLPEDWKFMSPQAANINLASTFDDPFDAHMTTQSPPSILQRNPRYDGGLTRSDSIMSNGERRPLPALPRFQEAIPEAEEVLPSPTTNPAAAVCDEMTVTEAAIPNRRDFSPSLNERLRPLALEQGPPSNSSHAVVQVAGVVDNNEVLEGPCDPVALALEVAAQQADAEPAHEILSEGPPCFVNGPGETDGHEFAVQIPPTSTSIPGGKIDYSNLDPDIPIPSREPSSNYEDEFMAVHIKQEPKEDDTELYDYPEHQVTNEYYGEEIGNENDYMKESSVIHHNVGGVTDVVSLKVELGQRTQGLQVPNDEAGVEQVRSAAIPSETFVEIPRNTSASNTRVLSIVEQNSPPLDEHYDAPGLPKLDSLNRLEDFGLSFQPYLTPPQMHEPNSDFESDGKKLDYFVPTTRPITPPAQTHLAQSEPSTPDSVIHHDPDSDVSSMLSVTIPEPAATIKAPGGRLKTRPSATPADFQTMAAARRIVSGDIAPPVFINDVLHVVPDDEAGQSEDVDEDDYEIGGEHEDVKLDRDNIDLKLHVDIPEIGSGLGLIPDINNGGDDHDFDQVEQIQKKGYLMRQNTKIVVASHRRISEDQRPGSRKASASGYKPVAVARKPSAQTWTTEPWNGKIRRHSTRRSSISPVKQHNIGPVPPLPGQDTNAISENGLLGEDQIDEMDPMGERGRLFVKVVGLKDLKLPMPKNERSWFQLTLDNGLHCVTTAWLELGRTAPIGQEFELTVFDDLEFTLTLQTKLERPKSQVSIVPTVSNSPSKPPKTSLFGRFMTSPKKRRELERKQQEEEALTALRMQEERDAERARQRPTAWDLQHEIVGTDGSFARAYVNLGDHEAQAFGRQLTVDIPAYNEWSVEDKFVASSTRSKLGGIQRRPPYEIGKLELQLLYIPKPKDVKDEDMPKSMSSCLRQLKEAETSVEKKWEGHLSQQGGDCPYWRRRFFKLDGSKLTAYHESTLQRRVTINLAKASRLIDDKSSLTKTDNTSPGKTGRSRRKSAFAEDEEGYMFVEEGFRIRFANGEVIDFYAENTAQKESWMKALADVIGKESAGEKQTWLTAVLARHKAEATRAGVSAASVPGLSKLAETKVQGAAARLTVARPAAGPAPMSSPAKAAVVHPAPVLSPMKAEKVLPRTTELPARTSSQRSAAPPQTRMQKLMGSGRRNAVKSMIF